MEQLSSIYPEDKKDMYQLLAAQIESVVGDQTLVISDLSNVSAILNEALKEINWVGFYLMKNELLQLGPFQGKLACTKIALGKGVCGTAAKERKTQLVEDVHQFPGHIACDGASNSEIVVPIIIKEEVMGVLDIDSPIFSRFDEEDQKGLEKIVDILERKCDWDQFHI
ncbi:free methionine-(R)-sulfoxide reductase [Lachnospiraceae bacterium KM106-2]|nr:free methionine-(R)-sulfoxide reductase [Lachnospiraceae bacterium KM106-2]